MKSFLIFVFCFWWTAIVSAGEEKLSFGRFGTVAIYQEVSRPSEVVLFVSGDGGWNLGVVEMAKALSELGALVVGIDINRYLKQLEHLPAECSYPAGDFEALSKFVQKKLNFPQYQPPLLMGYSSGATLVYAALVQAPPNTFQGAVSLGFCPDLQAGKPLCRGAGLEWKALSKNKGYQFLPTGRLRAPWIVFQGMIDQVCNAALTETFVKQVENAEIVLLPKVGHGFSVYKNWMPQFTAAFAQMANAPKTEPNPQGEALGNLPLVIVPAAGAPSAIMALIVSGDGGWAGIDRELADALAEQGVATVGINSLKYFWKKRTPAETAEDATRVLRYYLAEWKPDRVILIGYSMGAEVLPFIFNRLPPDIQAKIPQVALLSPTNEADFEFHFTGWMGTGSAKTVLPEIEKFKDIELLCFYGDMETDSLCKMLDPRLGQRIVLKGGHHLGGAYGVIAETVLKGLQ